MAKRYVILCPACDLCTEVARWGAKTCSGGCRVRLHRAPELWKPVEASASMLGVEPFWVLLAGAVQRLLPEMESAIRDGARDLLDVQDDLHAEIMRRLFGDTP